MASKHLHTEELRIVLVGKTGSRKTSFMNALLSDESASIQPSPVSDTVKCEMKKGDFEGQQLCVIDTPGVFNTEMTKEKVKKEIVKCFIYAAPGPHVFLYVLKAGARSDEDDTTLEIIEKIFGKGFRDYTLGLVIGKGESFEKMVRDKYKFNDVYAIDSNFPKDQINEVLEKVRIMKNQNVRCYSNPMFDEAQKQKQKRSLDNATQVDLEEVTEMILDLTVGEPFKSGLKLVIDLIAKQENKCNTQ